MEITVPLELSRDARAQHSLNFRQVVIHPESKLGKGSREGASGVLTRSAGELITKTVLAAPPDIRRLSGFGAQYRTVMLRELTKTNLQCRARKPWHCEGFAGRGRYWSKPGKQRLKAPLQDDRSEGPSIGTHHFEMELQKRIGGIHANPPNLEFLRAKLQPRALP